MADTLQPPSSAATTPISASVRPSDEQLLSAPPTTNLRDRLRGTSRGGHLQVVPSELGHPPQAVSPTVHSPAATTTPSIIAAGAPVTIGTSSGFSVAQIADLWPAIRNDVKAVNRRIEALLASIDPVSVNGNQITLVAAYDFHRKRLNEDEARHVVEDVMSRILKQPISIVCVLRGEEVPFASMQPYQPTAPIHSATVQSPVEEVEDARASETEDAVSTIEIDEQRINAAKNIFDAEEITS